jgi:hypothetical protein
MRGDKTAIPKIEYSVTWNVHMLAKNRTIAFKGLG